MDRENILKVWEIMSYSWTEIGLTDDEYLDMAVKCGFTKEDLTEIDKIIFKDVCFSFAPLSFLVFPCFLWMLMPDWGFDEKWLQEKANKWYARNYLLNFINPFVILGFPSSLFFVMSGRATLRKAILSPESITSPSRTTMLIRKATGSITVWIIFMVIISVGVSYVKKALH